ncbi:MAG: O-antigen ligase family protein [Patescibacteria group bacterium]
MKERFLRNFYIALISIFLAGIIGVIIAKTAFLSLVIIPILVLAAILFYLIVRSPELGWFLIIFFLPFERVPSIEMAGVNLKINTLLGFLTLFAWFLALMFNSKKYKVQPNVLAIPLGLFSIAMFLSLTQAVNLTRAIAVLIFILFTIMLSVLAVNIIKDKESLKKTLLVLFASSFLVGLFGLFQFAGDVVGLPRGLTLLKEGYTSRVFGFPRVQAFSMEPLYFANYLLIPICVGLALFVNKISILKQRWWLIALIILLLINFVLTVSRGGYAGLVVSLLVLGAFFLKKVLTWRNVLIGAVAVVVVVYGVSFALSKGEYRATNEFLGHVKLQDLTQGESIQGRLVTFERALRAYDQSPILGIGIGNYGPWAKNYPIVRPKTGWDIVNNEYIEILAETGILGLAAFSLVLVILIFRSFVAFKYAHDIFLKSVLIGLLAALAGILVQYNFMSTLYIIHVWILIGILVGVQNIILKQKD